MHTLVERIIVGFWLAPGYSRFLIFNFLAIAPSHPSTVAAQQPEPPTPPQPLAATEP